MHRRRTEASRKSHIHAGRITRAVFLVAAPVAAVLVLAVGRTEPLDAGSAPAGVRS